MKNYFHWSIVKIPLMFLAFSILYIVFSDIIILQFTDNPISITYYQVFKGWVYVSAASLILYAFIRQEIGKKNKVIEKISIQENQYRKLSEEYQIINKELKATSEKYFKIISRLSQPMLLVEGVWKDDALYDLLIVEINQAARNIMELNVEDETQNTILQFADPKLIDHILKLSKNVLETEEPSSSEFYSSLFKRFVELHLFKLSSNQIVFLYFDISNLKETEQNLIKAREKAEESDKLKTAFLQNMSHEIRTPMNGILGFSDLLCQDDIDIETRHKYLQVIQNSGHQLMHIIDDVLNLSRIEAGAEELYLNTFSLNSLYDELVLLYSKLLQQANSPVKIKISKSLSNPQDLIFSDEYKIKQVLLNFLSNAKKFTEEGSIELGYFLDNNKKLNLYVKDTGIGISQNKQEIIFERFRQAEENLNQKHGGTGLGLAICKGLAEILDGEIHLKSEEGLGSIFSLIIPYNPGIKSEEQVQITKENKSLAKHKVLIVDNLEENRLLLEEFFNNSEINIFTANNGEEAKQVFLEQDNIDLVLMDIKLDNESGIVLAKELMEINSNSKFIAQTAYISEIVKKECMRAGFVDYLVKPIDKNNFLKIVNLHLNN
ncbi:MAG: response regulator [Bacteroidales bacterium]|nr:response regulator [Bacteroidales bacterium]